MDMLWNPIAWFVVLLFTMLGVLGNGVFYQAGKRGVEAVRERFPRIKPEQWQRVETLYADYGAWVLLLSGLPLVGSLLTVGAGAFGIRPLAFVVLVFVAKLARNWLIVVVPIEIYRLFAG